MKTIERYVAKATGCAAATPFKIEVRFMGGLTEVQQAAFKVAANRWTSVIVGDLPSVTVDGEIIDDVVILAQGSPIDGVGAILGQAGPTALRPPIANGQAYLPAKGVMTFDTADLTAMEANGTLVDVITHEMGHVLGIGTIWEDKAVITGAGTNNPQFVGANAMREYARLKGAMGGAIAVPIESSGGIGTRDSHWRDSVFGNELMTGYVDGALGNPLSRLTIASLEDLGYQVDYATAEPYALPNHLALAEAAAPDVTQKRRLMMRVIPVVLPDDSMYH